MVQRNKDAKRCSLVIMLLLVQFTKVRKNMSNKFEPRLWRSIFIRIRRRVDMIGLISIRITGSGFLPNFWKIYPDSAMGKIKILPISIRIWLRVLREFSGVLQWTYNDWWHQWWSIYRRRLLYIELPYLNLNYFWKKINYTNKGCANSKYNISNVLLTPLSCEKHF